MAIPRVFVSSTCYDMRYIRENLKFFIRNMGFDPVLSEEGNVFYDPKLHVQDACLAEVPTCQMFVLLIGGRFGSKYKTTPKSITNHEYLEAVKSGVPIFALVDQQVHAQYIVYQKNKENPDIDATKIKYPAIDSTHIFNFMEEVQNTSINNSLVPFSNYHFLESYLKQQWAGMMYNFLVQQGESTRVSDTLSTLTEMSDRIEFLSKQILVSVGSDAGAISVKIYEKMVNLECIRALGFYYGIKVTPLDVVKAKDYKSLGHFKISKTDAVTVSVVKNGKVIGSVNKRIYDNNVKEFKKLKRDIEVILDAAGKTPEDFVRESQPEFMQ